MTEEITNKKDDPKKIFRNGKVYRIPAGETKEIPEEGEELTDDSKSEENEEQGE